MNGYGSHTFKLVDANGKAVYCKFHYKVHVAFGQCGQMLPPPTYPYFFWGLGKNQGLPYVSLTSPLKDDRYWSGWVGPWLFCWPQLEWIDSRCPIRRTMCSVSLVSSCGWRVIAPSYYQQSSFLLLDPGSSAINIWENAHFVLALWFNISGAGRCTFILFSLWRRKI